MLRRIDNETALSLMIKKEDLKSKDLFIVEKIKNMKKLDTTKVYYLGDLSDEQLLEFAKYFDENLIHETQFKDGTYEWLHELKNNCYFVYSEYETWVFEDIEDVYCKPINALTLFTKTKDERIAEIQLRIQELNNELIDLDEF